MDAPCGAIGDEVSESFALFGLEYSVDLGQRIESCVPQSIMSELALGHRFAHRVRVELIGPHGLCSCGSRVPEVAARLPGDLVKAIQRFANDFLLSWRNVQIVDDVVDQAAWPRRPGAEWVGPPPVDRKERRK